VTAPGVLGLLAVGTLAGLDLVSVPQAMLSRPLVAGYLGGAVAGRPLAGLAMGALLELFAFETLPVGAARYPDWGPAAAAAGALAALRGGKWDSAWMVGVMVVALVAAWLGGLTMHLARRLNGAQVRRRKRALDAGDPRALAAVQLGGIARDALRAAALTGLTFVVGERVARAVELGWRAPRPLADVAVVGTALGVAVWSAWRLYGQGTPRRWLATGGVAGIAALAGFLAW
jgi:mannose/fructose/N-acetylgalactosamine-specific phosphotransferase system component IIC